MASVIRVLPGAEGWQMKIDDRPGSLHRTKRDAEKPDANWPAHGTSSS